MAEINISRPAPAKLNLFLRITGRRADGYHSLQTVFQFINLCDALHFSMREDGQLHCVSDAPGLAPAQDLTMQAAQRLKQASGTPLGADIRVEKKIPMGGGLGGGSSDAATALLALNRLWQLGFSRQLLAVMGKELGADVPVFVFGRAAWAEGVGELLTPLDTLPEPWYLLIHPGCHVSTAEVFSLQQLTRDAQPVKMSDFLTGRNGGNDCETAVRSRYPEVGDALDWLNTYAPARLTGTGACVFAAFADQSRAKAALALLPRKWQGWVVQGMNSSPVRN
ncbi:MAG: 4-(cytidine 5'-diphospho)-2-C-methyl-D-erythritol kinase [Gammaproteobacteria bacterium]|nr:4-(cytidine 5'-diphospho)-2-C-methyl-D-erythritol kinase [Gammaproteobacteria bacterium]